MIPARGKEIQIKVTVVQNFVHQKLGKKRNLCSLVYIMRCFSSGGGTIIGHTDVTVAKPKTSECHQTFPAENLCTLQRLQQHLLLFCILC